MKTSSQKSGAGTANRRAESPVDQLKQDAGQVREDMLHVAGDARSLVNHSAEVAIDAAREKVVHAGEKAVAAAETARDVAKSEVDRCVAGFRDKPLTFLGLTAAGGLLLGAAIAGLSRRPD